MVALAGFGTASADEKLKGIACRSVHLGYPAPTGRAFYNEVTVDPPSSLRHQPAVRG
jgi:hypothetical protein